MSTVKEIEAAIKSLTPEAMSELRAWFAEYDGDEWDRQIEQDVASGKLDAMLSKAKGDFDRGRTTAL